MAPPSSSAASTRSIQYRDDVFEPIPLGETKQITEAQAHDNQEHAGMILACRKRVVTDVVRHAVETLKDEEERDERARAGLLRRAAGAVTRTTEMLASVRGLLVVYATKKVELPEAATADE